MKNKNKNIFCIISVLAGCITLLSSGINAAELTSYRADITATRNGTIDLKVKGEIIFSIEPDNTWSLEMKTKGGPLHSHEKSTGDFVNNQFRPLHYNRDSRFFLFKEHINWDFDWSLNNVAGKVKKKEFQHNLSSIVHDPLSYQLSFRKQLMEGQKEFKFSYLRYTKPEQISFKIVGQEILETKSGRINTLIIKQVTPSKKDRIKKIWVSIDYGHILIKFATYDNGKLKDEVLVDRLWVEGKPITFNE